MVNWESLLQGKTDGMTWAFGGMHVGDDISALPFDCVTLIDPRTPNVRRGQSSQGIFDIAEDESKSLVPREQLLSEFFRYGRHVMKLVIERSVRSGFAAHYFRNCRSSMREIFNDCWVLRLA